MGASNVFMNIVKSIEDSQLNYSIMKTPFSATISLKSSFVKRFGEATKSDVSYVSEKDTKVRELEGKNLKLQDVINQLKVTHENDQKKPVNELVCMQKLYDDEKERSKALEVQIFEFREEVLKVKKEKNEMTKKLKLANETLESGHMQSKSIVEENDVLKKTVENQSEHLVFKNEEVTKTKKENVTIKNDLNKIKTEFEILKVSELKLSKMRIKCDKCDGSVKNCDELKMHNKLYHSLSKASQYEQDETFKIFNCFYCDLTIDSEDQLEVHYSTCNTEPEIVLEPQVLYKDVFSFTCEICGSECRDRDDLERHWTIYHHLDVIPEELESDCFQCDICPLSYKKKIVLEFHKRGFHWGQFS